MAVKLKKWHRNYLLRRLAGDHVSRGHASRMRHGTQDLLARNHVSLQATLAHEYISTQGMLTREVRKQSMHLWT